MTSDVYRSDVDTSSYEGIHIDVNMNSYDGIHMSPEAGTQKGYQLDLPASGQISTSCHLFDGDKS